MFRKLTLLSMVLATYTHCLNSQEFDKEKLSAYFDTLHTYDKFMGSIVVSKNGVIVFSKTTGYINVVDRVKSQDSTKYRMGSISQTITAVLVLKTVEKNLLSLDETIEKYFPSIKNANRITIRNLLQHRSGIYNYMKDANYYKWYTNALSEKQMVEIISRGNISFEPNSQFEYNHSNYFLLSYILMKVHEKSFPEILFSEITSPLNLKHTNVGVRMVNNKQKVHAYRYHGIWVEQPETDLTIPMGAGNIIATALDIAEFAYKLFDGKILTAKSLEWMKNFQDGYGLGLMEMPYSTQIGYGYTGDLDGFSSIFVHFPEDKLSYTLLSNGNNYDLNLISMTVLAAMYQKPYDIPKFTKFSILTNELDQYVGVYKHEKLSFNVNIFHHENVLLAQATGQEAFPLLQTSKNVFKFEEVGLELTFSPKENKMKMKQKSKEFELIRMNSEK